MTHPDRRNPQPATETPSRSKSAKDKRNSSGFSIASSDEVKVPPVYLRELEPTGKVGNYQLGPEILRRAAEMKLEGFRIGKTNEKEEDE